MVYLSSFTEICLLIIVLILSYNLMTADANYKRTSKCQEKSCEYDYILTGNFHDRRGKEEGVTTITFTLQCESNGKYKKTEAKKYCIAVKKANIEMFEVEKTVDGGIKNNSKKTRKGGTDITKMMRQNYFCFVRDKDGEVLRVIHPRNENVGVVNLKKTIASAFQANFRKTKTKMESDSKSRHKSHYVYSKSKDKTIEHRYVHSKDVEKYASNKKKNGISVESEEDIELDKNNVIQGSRGESRTSVTKKVDSEEDEDAGAQEDIPPIETKSTYTLKLTKCVNSVEAFEFISGHEQETDSVTDTLLARFNEREHHQFEMEDLYLKLPDLQRVARQAARSTDENEKIKITNSFMGNWRRLLHLESKHGALGGRKPKIFQLRKILKESLQTNKSISEDFKHLRFMLYSLLNSEGSLVSQKALLEALRMVENEEEHTNILLSLALLESPRPSTVSSLKEYVLEKKENKQLLLTFATLGRHAHAEEEVVESVVSHLVESSTTINDSSILYYIHALGNTGSSLMVPYIEQFLSSENEVVKLAAIDALRTISDHDLVQKLFIDLLDTNPPLDTLLAIVDSLNFPYQSFVYYPDLVEPKENDIENELIEKLVNVTIDADDADLNKQTKKFLKNIGTKTALQLLSTFNEHSMHLFKRSQTSQWNSRQALYNVVASYASRANDVYHYPYHKAYLWARTFGPPKIHMKLGAGGFGGVGATGFKVFAKGAIHLYVYGRTFEVVHAEYMNRYHLAWGPYSKKFVKAIGITFLHEESGVGLPYQKTWSKNLYSKRLFRLQYRIWVWIGFLTFYIEGHVNVDASLAIKFYTQNVEANTDFGPTFSVTGGASLTLLIFWRVGLEVKASIGYYVTPKASVTLCDNAPRGDLSGCFGIFHGSRGINVQIYAYFSRKRCSWRRWWFRCKWGRKSKLSLFSSTYTLGRTLTQQLLWGKCTACDCRGSIHGYCAKALGMKPVATGCYCRLAGYA